MVFLRSFKRGESNSPFPLTHRIRNGTTWFTREDKPLLASRTHPERWKVSELLHLGALVFSLFSFHWVGEGAAVDPSLDSGPLGRKRQISRVVYYEYSLFI